MRKLVFATNNKHKLEEVRDVAQGHIEILSLKEIDCFDDIPETADTLEGNALLKARHVFDKYGYNCFADDTGLEVEALDGRPGVYSARYAGEDQDALKNVQKLLAELN
jgi:XTP/dITP diphosphohydrolase